MFAEHNSRLLFYRTPFGATPVNTDITLRIAISGIGIPHSVKCIVMGENEHDMTYSFSICEKNIYECTFTLPEAPSTLWYYFKAEYDGGALFYGNNDERLGGTGKIYENEPEQKFQITVYAESFKTPQWFRKSVAYQIFPDRYFNGNQNGEFCDEKKSMIKRNWGEMPYYKAEQFGGEYLSNDFFGGNLKGIAEKLPYLQELGISVLYLNPVFEASSNHRYDTGDYEKIDSVLGTEEDFKNLCEKAEKLGIRIILDGVFNHTGSNSKYFNKNGEYETCGAYQCPDSPYRDWFMFGNNRDEYECWWGMKTLPHTNEKCEAFQKYLLTDENAIIKKWLRLGASGWRLDVVDELPGFFVKMLRENVKKVSEENVIIGEVWEDASNKVSYDETREYFLGKELDSVMNYPLRNALVDAVLMNINAYELDRRIMSLKENYPKDVFYSCLNLLSSHDIERIITAVSGAKKPESRDEQASFTLSGEMLETAKKRVLAITAVQMLLPGVPCIYYGDEIGMEGFADPFCRQTFKWENANNDFSKSYRQWIKLRNSSDAFSDGEFESVYTIGNVYGFVRYNASEKYVVIANLSPNFEKIRLDVGKFGITNMESVLGEEKRASADGIYWIDMPEYWVKVFKVC